MDEVAAQQEISNEISEAISTSIGFGKYFDHIFIAFSLEVSLIDGFLCFSGNSYDEDELERELEELEQEELDEHLLSVRSDEHTLPDVPNGDVKIPNAAAEPNKKSMSLVNDLHHWLLHQWRIKNILFIKNNFSFF